MKSTIELAQECVAQIRVFPKYEAPGRLDYRTAIAFFLEELERFRALCTEDSEKELASLRVLLAESKRENERLRNTPEGIVERLKDALNRVVNDWTPMSIPLRPGDVDLVLAECIAHFDGNKNAPRMAEINAAYKEATNG